jgi:molecular chaperone DnaJ
MAGKGIPHLGGNGRGDQLIQIDVWVPTRLSTEERIHVEELAESKNLAPPEGDRGFWRKMREAFST